MTEMCNDLLMWAVGRLSTRTFYLDTGQHSSILPSVAIIFLALLESIR